MKNIVLIANPVSGNGLSVKAAEITQQTLAAKGLNVHISYTQHAGHASQLAKNFINEFDIIVAIGGDGTVNEIASALVNSPAILGIIPTGSGNGLARHLKIPMNLKSAIKCLYREKVVKIDAPKVNNEYFFCTAGIGFDAQVSHSFANMKGRGFMNYIKATFLEYFKYRSKNYALYLDTKKKALDAFVITIANAAQYGNNAYIAPKAKINDGLLEVTLLPKPSFFDAINFSIRLFTKKIHKHNKVKTLQTETIKIDVPTENGDIYGHKDGEPEIWHLPLEFSLKSNDKLTVIGNTDKL
ncbi:diacylglycerol/lipid kinase family protein [Flammeovirga kamogawensis]|uniref:Diacylglycerol kinase family lipid kinase n=1 Tax=Flammeovirga kamogawensis TaxID=373891 RepID=A0ABX8GY36_9BACT|nr:diacylglycerol kinase family protein [Flammeovirga kamogawensis]MBB6458946.1 YegS/Rv2252/BmrU family lipid kinase [Flammeovirga kamogawensis]QWG08521.1 diacylglycerol kinase family lipid kinase [Flammeovirga kamogawensis]TRX66814.1 diacylglycerol kinase family lipid kinase [Flammeovirga kamogawensis]